MFRRKHAESSPNQVAVAAMQAEIDELRRHLESWRRDQAVVEFDMTGAVIQASPAFLGMLGYTAEALMGMSRNRLVVADAARLADSWARLARGDSDHGELEYRAGDGSTRWLLTTSSVVTGADGAPARVVTTATDITGLRHEMKELKAELDVRKEIMNLTSIVSEADKKGDIVSINEKFIEVSQYSRDELLGHPHSTTRHPDMPKSVFKAMWSTIGHGEMFRGVIKNRAKDGTPYYVDAVIAPIIGDNGKPKKYLGVRYDITATEIERQNARGILDAINGSFGYIEFDLAGRILSANDNFLTLMGYRSEEVVGQHHRMFVEPEYGRSDAYRQFWAELEEGKAQYEAFLRFGKGGREVWIQATYVPVKDDMGRVFKVVKIATDITARKQYELSVHDMLLRTADVMSAVADGDLTRALDGEVVEEFAGLQTAVNATVTRLREVVGQIRGCALSINTAASEVAKGNTELSARTEEQASSLEETAASMEKMTSTVAQNADNSRHANQLAASARDQANQGGDVVGQAVAAMSAINQSSRQIADIIGVIDEIAFQTNLLALNAAVEAARAGEQGRGFAVVASEVRNLAQRSASAAKEIKTLIKDSVEKVAEGSRLVDASGATLGDIVLSVKKVSDIIAEIAVASEEQSVGIGQVNQAVTQMDQMTQQNAALVEQAAAASESMDEESRTLLDLVQFFNTGDARTTSARPIERRGAARPWSSPAAPAAGNGTRPVARAAAGGGSASDTWDEF